MAAVAIVESQFDVENVILGGYQTVFRGIIAKP